MTDLGEQFNHNDFQIVAKEDCYSGFFHIKRYTVKHRLFAGGWSQPVSREIFLRDNATCVLLYDPERDMVVLVEQFRVGGMHEPETPWLLELVAGINEEGETAETVARREAIEEAGCEITDLVHIGNYLASPGGSSEKVDLFCGRVDTQGVGGLHGLEHEGEDIRVHLVSASGAYAMVESGRVNNAPAIIALQWLQLNREKVRAAWLDPEN